MAKKPIEIAGTVKLNCSMVYFIVEIRKYKYLIEARLMIMNFRFNEFYFHLKVRC